MLATSGPAAAADTTLCTLRDPRVSESSGVVAGDDGVFFTHDDSGDTGRFFEVDRSCHVVVHPLVGIRPRDIEDIARAPDGALLLGDIGDNRAVRTSVVVYRVAVSGRGPVTSFRLRYGDGPHDAETLLAGPDGQVGVVTKSFTGTSALYVGELAGGVLRRAASLQLGPTGTPGGPAGPFGQLLVTGGDLRDGLLVLRTYTDAYLWRLDPALPFEAALEAALARPPARRALPPQPQGEGIALTADGRLLLTSEGVGQPVLLVAAPPVSAPTGSGADTGGSSPAPGTAMPTGGPSDLVLAPAGSPWPLPPSVGLGVALGVVVCALGLVGVLLGRRRRS